MNNNIGHRWHFGPFEVDLQEQRLWRDGQVLPITHKSFALLCALISRPATLITKAELFSTVWAGRVVTDSALSRAVRELRVALGDDAAHPSYIETAHGLGLRFVARLSSEPLLQSRQPKHGLPSSWLVGRETELQQLDNALGAARAGRRQLVFVSGEPGVGKTALVEAFMARHAEPGELWTVQGRCIDQYGTREPYLPILEALEQLAGQVGANHLRQTLERYAPAWLVQLPWLAHAADSAALRRAAPDTTAQRMLRELAQALEALASERPIVLWLEDLHWSDSSSLDVVAYLAGRRDPARLMVIASLRPGEVQTRDNPLLGLTQDLSLRGQACILPLERLTHAALADYLRRRFESSAELARDERPQANDNRRRPPEGVRKLGSAPAFADELARFIHHRTEGNALFAVAMVDDLVRRGDLIEPATGWCLRCPVAELATGMPDNLRQLIHRQFVRLSEDERQLLEAAAVAGTDFACASVAAALQIDVIQVEDRCAELARNGRFLRARPSLGWPDGSLSGGFGFVHALYWQAMQDQVSGSRRVAWQRSIGLRQEQAYGDQCAQIATELAMRFEIALDAPRSIRYLQLAAASALARCAYQEGVDSLSHALSILQRQPANGRDRLELDLLLSLGGAQMVTRGYASGDVAATYQRALLLCRTCGKPGELVRTLRGLWNVSFIRADLAHAQHLAEELMQHAHRSGSPSQLFDAHAKIGQTCMHLGHFRAARLHLEQALALPLPAADPLRQREAPRVVVYLALVLCYSGHPAQAVACCEQALLLADQVASPHSKAYTLGFVCWVARLHGDTAQALDLSRQQLALSVEHGLPFWRIWSEFSQGLFASQQGEHERGIDAMARAIAAFGAMDAELGVTHFLCLYAQACLEAGLLVAARQALDDSTAMAARNGNAYAAAEVNRLMGEVRLAEGATPGAIDVALAHFERALEVARQQGARAFELRAAISLARLWARGGQAQRGVELLAPLCASLTDGLETADLRNARSLLRQWQHQHPLQKPVSPGSTWPRPLKPIKPS